MIEFLKWALFSLSLKFELHLIPNREIAEYQKANFFASDVEKQKEDMKRLSEIYGSNIIEHLIDGFKCENCQKDASKRCSRCKAVWYCGKDCQVEWNYPRLMFLRPQTKNLYI